MRQPEHLIAPFLTVRPQLGHTYFLSFEASVMIFKTTAAPSTPIIKAISPFTAESLIFYSHCRFAQITNESVCYLYDRIVN